MLKVLLMYLNISFAAFLYKSCSQQQSWLRNLFFSESDNVFEGIMQVLCKLSSFKYLSLSLDRSVEQQVLCYSSVFRPGLLSGLRTASREPGYVDSDRL